VILADTSAWVEYDRATGSDVDRRMTTLIRADGALAITEPVMMELLAGAGSDDGYAQLRRLLARFPLLRFDPVSDLEAAARIYRSCRRSGITPRGMVDCMIAAVGWRHATTLLTRDTDLVRVARVTGIALDDACPVVR
jgi:predicted nucleic acid-binding protein